MSNQFSITFGGARIVVSHLALEYHRKANVIRCGDAGKKRKRWRVSIVEWTTPSAYRLQDGTMVVHPKIYAAIKEQS